MEQYLLIAILVFTDGSAEFTLPIESFKTFETCNERAGNGRDIVDKVNDEWVTYMENTGDIRPISQIGLTCTDEYYQEEQA